VRVWVVIDNKVHGLDILPGSHGQVGLDDDRHDSTILSHKRHVQADVASPDRPPSRNPLEDPGNLFVGCLGIVRRGQRFSGGQEPS
jgi:hypothetical protein